MTLERDDPLNAESGDLLGLELTVIVIARPAERYDLNKMSWYGSKSAVQTVLTHSYQGMRRGTHHMLVADLNNSPVGLVCLQHQAKDPQMADGQTRSYLYAFRVMPNLRHLGIGTLLLNAAEMYLSERGMTKITLQVARENLAAQRLFTRHGYRSFGSKVNIWYRLNEQGERVEVREDCWAMEKQLPPRADHQPV